MFFKNTVKLFSHKLPRNEHLWNVTSESFGHLAVSDVSNALHCKRNVNRVAAWQVIADWLNHQLHQLTAAGNENWYKQIALVHRNTTHSCYNAADIIVYIILQHTNSLTDRLVTGTKQVCRPKPQPRWQLPSVATSRVTILQTV